MYSFVVTGSKLIEKGGSWVSLRQHTIILTVVDHSTARDRTVGIRLARRLPCATG
jgi:hypothetical protein